MENRYRVYRRDNGIYYIEDVVTSQQEIRLFDQFPPFGVILISRLVG